MPILATITPGKIVTSVTVAGAMIASVVMVGSGTMGNHVHMVALYTVWYNFARINSAVRMSLQWRAAQRIVCGM